MREIRKKILPTREFLSGGQLVMPYEIDRDTV